MSLIKNGNTQILVRWGVLVLGAGMWLGSLSVSSMKMGDELDELIAVVEENEDSLSQNDKNIELIQKDIEYMKKEQQEFKEEVKQEFEDVDKKLDKILDKLN